LKNVEILEKRLKTGGGKRRRSAAPLPLLMRGEGPTRKIFSRFAPFFLIFFRTK